MRYLVNKLGFQTVILGVIVGMYLLFAPNYDWSDGDRKSPYGADFLQEWVGAKLIVTGNASKLYDLETFKEWQYDSRLIGFCWDSENYFPPVYPPPHYMLFSPFAFLPYRWATVLWLVSLVAAAMISARTIATIVESYAVRTGLEDSLPRCMKSRYLGLGLFLFPSLLFSITLGQKSVYWLLIVCLTWRLLQSQRDFVAGLLFGILSIKPTLFFLLPLVMLRHRRWQFFLGATVSVLVLWGTAFWIVPLESWVAFANGLKSAGSYAEIAGYRIEWSCNLMTLAYSVPDPWVTWCKWAMCVPLTMYLLYCVLSDKSHPIVSAEKALMVLATTLAVSPHTYHYDLCILLLPILWLAATSPRQGFAYYAMLAVGVVVAEDMQELLHIPIVPILLIGMVCELRLRGVLPAVSACKTIVPSGTSMA